MPNGGKIEIRSAINGDRLRLQFEDNGTGMPEDVRQKIFDPFFTTKAPGEGTGLGLSLSYGLVKAHGGILDYEARQEGGAEFRIVRQRDELHVERYQSARTEPGITADQGQEAAHVDRAELLGAEVEGEDRA